MSESLPSGADIDAVLVFLPVLEKPGFIAGVPRGGDRLPDGSIQMPWVELAPQASALMSAFYQHHFVFPFDWPAWQTEAERYFRDPQALAQADLDVLRKLVTTHVRKDRFCEGHFAEMISCGHIAAILRRLKEVRNAPKTGVRIALVRGDITKLAVDAIVNAANSGLLGGGGVDGAIHGAAGPELLAACRKLGGCPTGEARITPGFRLPARYVIHAVGPIWRGGNANEASLLASAYRHSLELAAQHKCRTVACSAISCGVYGFPIPQAAEIALRTIRETTAKLPDIEEVLVVAFDDAVARAYEALGVRPS